MTVKTNCPDLEYELKLTAGIFGAEGNLSHNFLLAGKKAVNRIDVSGRTFIFERDLPENLSKVEEKRLLKRYAKIAVFSALFKITGTAPEWGALTGIRPVKLARQAISEGLDFKRFLKDNMYVSDKKIGLVERILKQQENIAEGGACLYVGIPFCPSRCSYCSFISMETDKAKGLLEGYIECLIKEIKGAKEIISSFRSVYIGGGTPVSISVPLLKRILDAIGEQNTEYTVEAGRPDCITEDKLKLFKDYGVTRLCVNPQTFNDAALKRIGRAHNAVETEEKYRLVKEYGFDVNMDIIAGLPAESLEDFKHTVDRLAGLLPDNATVHTLALKSGSKLKEDVILEKADFEQSGAGKMVDYSIEKLSLSGYEPYYLYRQKYMAENLENVGYSLKGKQCLYNILNMEEMSDIVACGANGVSKRLFLNGERIERYGNPKDIKTYIEKCDKIIEEKQLFYR